MTGFTSGPWQIKSEYLREDELTIIANVDGEYIDGQVHSTYDTIARCLDAYDEALPNARANARLIAASPSLYDALRRFRELADSSVEGWERTAAEFYTATGLLRPGKSEPMHFPDRERRAKWVAWISEQWRAADEAADAALARAVGKSL